MCNTGEGGPRPTSTLAERHSLLKVPSRAFLGPESSSLRIGSC